MEDLRTGALVPYGEGGWLYTSPPGLGEFLGLPAVRVSPGPGQPFIELGKSPAGAAVDGTDILIAGRTCNRWSSLVQSDLLRLTLDGEMLELAGPWSGVCVFALGRSPEGQLWILAAVGNIGDSIRRRGYLLAIESDGGLRFEAELPPWVFGEHDLYGVAFTQLIVHEDSLYLSGWGLPVTRIQRTQTEDGGSAFAFSHVVPRECRRERLSKQYTQISPEHQMRERSGTSIPLETTRALQRLGAEVENDEVWLTSYAADHERIIELLGEIGAGGVIHPEWDDGEWLLRLPPGWRAGVSLAR